MQLTRFCIVLLTYLHPISAVLKNAQTTLNEGDVEIRVCSNPNESCVQFLLEHALSLSSKVASEPQDNVTLINFNAIELALPLAPITKYSPLNLAGFSLLNVPQAYLEGNLSAGDLDCAKSAPNALLGSRSNRSIWLRFSLSSSFSSSSSKSKTKRVLTNAPDFQLLTLTVKPLHLTPRFVRLIGQGYTIEGGRAIHYSGFTITWLRSGYQRPQKFDLTEWDYWKNNVSVFEMWAETEDGDDWEFCLDNIEIAIAEDE